MNRRIMLGSVAGLLAETLAAQTSAAKGDTGRRAVLLQDLPKVTLDNWTVTATEISYSPGASSAQHKHPGFVLGYVLEGEVRMQVKGQPEMTFGVGQMFYEPPGAIHAVSRNASDTKPARFLAMVFAEKGKPTVVPA
jgi:quercetin dioxygenase-like cupin family protein